MFKKDRAKELSKWAEKNGDRHIQHLLSLFLHEYYKIASTSSEEAREELWENNGERMACIAEELNEYFLAYYSDFGFFATMGLSLCIDMCKLGIPDDIYDRLVPKQ